MIIGTSKAIEFLEQWFTTTPSWRQRCWQGAKSIDGKSHYGSYKPINRNNLVKRDFKLGIEGYGDWAKPSIEWIDVYFDPKLGKYVDKTRIYQAAEYMEWMSASPFPAVRQYLLNRGYSVDEINAATKLWMNKVNS